MKLDYWFGELPILYSPTLGDALSSHLSFSRLHVHGQTYGGTRKYGLDENRSHKYYPQWESELIMPREHESP